MSRRNAREIAFKLVFEFAFNKRENKDEFEEYTAGLSEDDKAYISEVYFGVASHYDELEEKISSKVEKFAFERLFKVDLAILLVACYEIFYMEDIPFKVSANEALDIAEKYSTSKSVKYINGVLASFAR